MDIQEIAVNTETLRNDVANMRNALSSVKRRTESMFQEINALSGMWEGQAHQAFLRQFMLDYQKLLNLQKTINQLIEYMQCADREYRSCEDSIRSTINAIRI